MSRLYSSPEVISLEIASLEVVGLGLMLSWSHHAVRQRHAHLTAVQLNSTQILPYVAVNKDALPNSPAIGAGCIKSFRLPKQAQASRVSFEAQYLAFVRSTAGSSAAL
jgi:hypothetical protein